MIAEALLWLALNVHHEARGEPYPCQVMVAEVVLRRVQSKYYPNDVKSVVLEHKQFSWTLDDSKYDLSVITYKDKLVALEAMSGSYYTTDELHYARYDVENYWTTKYQKSMQCGEHMFFYNGGKP